MTGQPRVVVTRMMVGICHMSVCAVKDATDEDILEVCNRENVSGTTGGWSHVVRENEPPCDLWPVEKMKPVPCAEDPERIHFMVAC